MQVGVPSEPAPSSPYDLADQYLALAETHRPTLECVLFHLRRICRDGLRQFELREDLESLGSSVSERARKQLITTASLSAARAIVKDLRDYAEGRRQFTPKTPVGAAPTAAEAAEAAAAAAAQVSAAAARAKAAAAAAATDNKARAAAEAACAAKRKDFEQMQRRKAKRQGLPEDHFLNQGRAPPTTADVAKARAMAETDRMKFWRENFGQHCIMHHMSGQCEVALAWGCGFLHEAATP
jgi:hypothetical protein